MVRLAISSVASKAGFDVEAVEDVEVSVAEACKNIICHGREGFVHSYEVEVELSALAINILVRDACSGEESLKLHRPCKCCPQEGNLALVVIDTLMDEAEDYMDDSGSRVIRMVKRK